MFRLLNKKESEDQAHVYVPAERKQKIEESPKILGHKENKFEESSNKEPENITIVNEGGVNNKKSEPMDIQPNVDDGTAIKDESVKMLDGSKNIDNTEVTDTKKKPILTDDDLNNFKKSISYVRVI